MQSVGPAVIYCDSQTHVDNQHILVVDYVDESAQPYLFPDVGSKTKKKLKKMKYFDIILKDARKKSQLERESKNIKEGGKQWLSETEALNCSGWYFKSKW